MNASISFKKAVQMHWCYNQVSVYECMYLRYDQKCIYSMTKTFKQKWTELNSDKVY